MAEYGGYPVYQPPDTMSTLSSLMGLKQRQLEMQKTQLGMEGQVSQNQSLAAEAQQNQQKNTELQAVGNLTKNADQYKSPDGSFDNQSFMNDVNRVAPTYGGPIANLAASRANEITQNKQAVQNLTTSKREVIGNAFQGLAGKTDVTPTDVINTIEGVRQQYPNDPEMSRLLTSFSTALPAGANSQQLQKTLGTAASMALGKSQAGAGTNAAGQNQVVNPMTGERSAPALSGGATNPSSPQVAGQTSQQTGGAGLDVDRAKEVGDAQQHASSTIQLSQRVDQLAEAINSGTLAKKFSEAGGYLGMSSVNQARTELQKDLGLLRGPVAAAAGSDSRAATLLEGYPTDTTPSQTIHAAMDYIRGTARQTQARGQLLQRYQGADGPRGFAAADNILTNSTNPLMHEYASLAPKDQAAFYTRNFKTPQEAQAFKDQVNALKKHTNVIGQ